MKKKVLGRGLGALIPDDKPVLSSSNEIDIDRIVPNPKQPRLTLDEARLEELAASIKENGVLQPVLVRPMANGYQLVAGERRLAAAQRAGLLKIPAQVRDIPDDRLLEYAMIENLQRDDLNPMEEAQAYQQFMDETDITQEEAAGRLKKDRSTIANSLRLLKLPPAVKALVAERKLSPGHARALLASNASPSEMTKVAAMIIEKDWSVREAEKWAKHKEKPARLLRVLDPNETAAVDRLRLALGTKVELHAGSRGKGEIRIHYYSQEELMRLYTILVEKANPSE